MRVLQCSGSCFPPSAVWNLRISEALGGRALHAAANRFPAHGKVSFPSLIPNLNHVRGFRLQPRRTPYRKYFKSICFNDIISDNKTDLKFGSFGCVSVQGSRVKAATLESMRRAVRRKIGKKGRLIMRIFPHFPVTKKPLEVRMGKGKGNVEYYAGCIRPGAVIFELDNVTRKQAMSAVFSARHCIKNQVKFVEWN